jgi:hypothetical protein
MADLTYRLFMVATVAMLAGTAYLLMSSREVDPKFRKGVYRYSLGIYLFKFTPTILKLNSAPLHHCFPTHPHHPNHRYEQAQSSWNFCSSPFVPAVGRSPATIAPP